LTGMGAEAKCTATISGKKAVGKALLETDELIFRGEDVRLTIPYKSVSSIDVKDGVLHVAWLSGVASFELGSSAVKWADRIRNPPSRIDKLDVKPGQLVLFVGIRDSTLREEIETRGATVLARVIDPVDAIFVAVNERGDLRRLATVQSFLKRDGAIWVIRPKGSPNISESDVMSAGKSVGLVDVKVVRFSETHTAEKFVIPVSKR
jgi:Protein of unknown function (DUF3052)